MNGRTRDAISWLVLLFFLNGCTVPVSVYTARQVTVDGPGEKVITASPGTYVNVHHVSGAVFQGRMVQATADEITLNIQNRDFKGERTIPLDEVVDVIANKPSASASLGGGFMVGVVGFMLFIWYLEETLGEKGWGR